MVILKVQKKYLGNNVPDNAKSDCEGVLFHSKRSSMGRHHPQPGNEGRSTSELGKGFNTKPAQPDQEDQPD